MSELWLVIRNSDQETDYEEYLMDGKTPQDSWDNFVYFESGMMIVHAIDGVYMLRLDKIQYAYLVDRSE